MLGAGIIGINIARRNRRGLSPTPPPIHDTFTRANSTTSLGVTDTGKTWTAAAGTWGIRNGKGYNASDANSTFAWLETGATAYTVSFDSTGEWVTNSRSLHLMLHYVDSSNYIFANFAPTKATINTRIAGVNVEVTNAAFTPVNGTTYNLKVSTQNGIIRFYVDNVLKPTYTMSSGDKAVFLNATKVGVRQSKSGTPTTNADFDNFIVTFP